MFEMIKTDDFYHSQIDIIIIMSIIYAVIGKTDKIFSEYTSSSGNFPVIASQVLKACDDRKYVKYAASGYMFYILNVQCTFMIMCERTYSERIAYNFLQNIRKLFLAAFSQQRIQNAKMYEMMQFSSVMKSQVNLYNEPEQVDKVARLLKQTEEVSKIIQEDLQKILARGQKLDILVKKTETMATLSLQMKSSSRTIRNDMMIKNLKTTVLLVLAIAFAIYLLFFLACGGFTLKKCF